MRQSIEVISNVQRGTSESGAFLERTQERQTMLKLLKLICSLRGCFCACGRPPRLAPATRTGSLARHSARRKRQDLCNLLELGSCVLCERAAVHTRCERALRRPAEMRGGSSARRRCLSARSTWPRSARVWVAWWTRSRGCTSSWGPSLRLLLATLRSAPGMVLLHMSQYHQGLPMARIGSKCQST